MLGSWLVHLHELREEEGGLLGPLIRTSSPLFQ